MRIEDEFEVQASAGDVWAYFLEVDRVVPCVPGAADVQRVSDTEWTGKVRLRLGPMSLVFDGRLVMDGVDDAARTLTLKGRGKDQKGKGTAGAVVTVRVSGDQDAARVEIVQDITVTGAIAQFGRGVMQDVSTRLVGEFARCLQQTILADLAASSSGSAAGAEHQAERQAERQAEHQDARDQAGHQVENAVEPGGQHAKRRDAGARPSSRPKPIAAGEPRVGMLALVALRGMVRRGVRRLWGRAPRPARPAGRGDESA